MFGCHNCKKRPVPGFPYEQTACARCRTVRDPSLLSYRQNDWENVPDKNHFNENLFQPFGSSMEKYRNDLLTALARTILILVRMRKRNPGTYRVVEAKIANPYASYSQLAEILCCRKQNIFYHLKRAFKICPELESALFTSHRWNQR